MDSKGHEETLGEDGNYLYILIWGVFMEVCRSKLNNFCVSFVYSLSYVR